MHNIIKTLKTAAHGIKDVALSAYIKSKIDPYISKYGGKMISFKMDTTGKQIDLSLELRGELQPLDFTIKYELYQDVGDTFIKATSIQSSREWINLLLAELIEQGSIKPLQVPSGIAEVALKVLGV